MADYGSLPTEVEPLKHLSLHAEGSRSARIDYTHVLINIVVPVAIFTAAFAALSFKLHYDYWCLAWVIALAAALPAVYVGFQAASAFKKDGRARRDSPQGRWLRLLCAFCVFAWVLGVALGMINFSSSMLPYYDLAGLNYYTSVEASASGQSHIDAGRLMFKPGTIVQKKRAMGVRVSETYCVAPIIDPSVPADKRMYDYWAVGMNCCSSTQPQDQWSCGEVDNHLASAGMRLMEDAPRPFYRMAVQEAEATYHIKANHPIFLRWMQDPSGKMAVWRESGRRFFIESILSFSLLMFFLSCSAGIYFTRAFSQSQPCEGTGFYKYVDANPEHDWLAEEGHTITKRINL